MKWVGKPTLIAIFFNGIVCFIQGYIQITRLLDRKLRKKKGFSLAFYNYISIIFMWKRGVYIMEVTSKTESVVVKYEGRVATVMVNRPEVLNALDEPTLKSYYKS